MELKTITVCSLNRSSFLNLLVTDPNVTQTTRSPPSELSILRRRDGRWRAGRTWQAEHGIFHPSQESSRESRVYYHSCRRAGWRDHSNSRRHDRADVQSLRARANHSWGKVKEEFQGPCESQERDDGCQAERPSRDRAAYSSPQTLRMIPHVHFCPGTEKLPTGVMGWLEIYSWGWRTSPRTGLLE